MERLARFGLAQRVGALLIAAACGGSAGSPGGESEGDEPATSPPGTPPLDADRVPSAPDMDRGAPSNLDNTGASRVCSLRPSADGFLIVTTQQGLDELAGCEEISGPLNIDAPDGVPLDLRPLASLSRVTGPVTIGCNPYLGSDSYCGQSVERSLSLDGLENLESAASLTIGGLRVPSLASLRNLRDIGQELTIVNCNSLETLAALDGVPVATVSLQSNAQLSSSSGLTLTPVASRVHIQGAPALTDLSALARLVSIDHLELREMPLQNLDVLRNLTAVTSLVLIDVPQLNDMSGASQIRQLDRLYLENSALENLDDLQLDAVEQLDINHNPALVDIDALGSVSRLDRLSVVDNDNLARLPAFPNVTESTWISLQFNAALAQGPSLPNLKGMPSGTIAIFENPNLLAIDGFSGLTEVAAIEIAQNARLTAVDFGQLTSAGTLRITCNPALPDATLAPLMQISSSDRQLDGNLGSEALCQPF